MNDPTTEEQQAAKDKVDQAVVNANADIDNAAANNDVDNAKLQMKLQSQPLHLMQMLNLKRNKQLQIKYKRKKQQLMLITVQQQKRKQQRNNKFKQKTTADTAIDGAHSNAEVEAAKNAEIAKIEAIQPATTTKDDAETSHCYESE